MTSTPHPALTASSPLTSKSGLRVWQTYRKVSEPVPQAGFSQDAPIMLPQLALHPQPTNTKTFFRSQHQSSGCTDPKQHIFQRPLPAAPAAASWYLSV